MQAGVRQGSVLGPHLFLFYMNDLNKFIKNLRAYYVTVDTNILVSNKSLKLVAKKMNQDLKNVTQWLKAKKLSLNIKKTERTIFHPKNT